MSSPRTLTLLYREDTATDAEDAGRDGAIDGASATLDVLEALARGEIDIDDAMARLDALDA